jgi:hypothetical protein
MARKSQLTRKAKRMVMKRLSLTILGGLVLASVAACHTDPFGTQPEVNVTLPEAQSAPSDEAGASTEEKRDPET